MSIEDYDEHGASLMHEKVVRWPRSGVTSTGPVGIETISENGPPYGFLLTHSQRSYCF